MIQLVMASDLQQPGGNLHITAFTMFINQPLENKANSMCLCISVYNQKNQRNAQCASEGEKKDFSQIST